MTAAANVKGLTFGDYETSLRRWVPIVRDAGAQIVVVETHICPTELALLDTSVRDLDIDLFEGGHCHEARVMSASGTRLSTASAYWRDYAITRLVFDLDAGEIVQGDQELIDVLYPTSAARPVVDADLDRIIDKWPQRAELALGEVIAYTGTGLAEHSQRMYNLLVDSWLWAYPNADVAISNVGGFRQDLAPGEITLGGVVGVFPFDNELYELEVEGRDLLTFLRAARLDIVVGGITTDAQGRVTMDGGSPLDPRASYHVLTTDYMYHNAKYRFGTYDGDPYETSIHWRQPVIDWLRAQRSTPQHPVEEKIDDRAWF